MRRDSAQKPVSRSFDVLMSIPSRRRWFETPSRSLWRDCNGGVSLVNTRVAAALGSFSGCQRFGIALCWRYPKWPTKSHNDVIKWNYFSRYWLFVRGIHWSPVRSPPKGPEMWPLMFFWCRSHKLLDKHSNDRWFGTEWYSCNFIVMQRNFAVLRVLTRDWIVPLVQQNDLCERT